MKNLLEYILIRLVENPDEVKVTETVGDDGFIILNVTANPADYGRIIGRGGAVITSIRNIIRVRAIKEGKRVAVKIDADGESDRGDHNGHRREERNERRERSAEEKMVKEVTAPEEVIVAETEVEPETEA